MGMSMSEWLKVKEFADRLGLSDQFIYDEIRSRRLAAHRFGGTYRIRRDDAEHYVDEHRTGPGQPEPKPEPEKRKKRKRKPDAQ